MGMLFDLQLFASTKIADVIVPEVFNDYVVERTAELSEFVRSGIIEKDALFDKLATAGGKLINMPFWNDLTGDDEVLSDSNSLTVNKIGSGQDIAVLLMRGKAWGVNDLATALSGDDPMKAIGDLVAEYWVRKLQTTTLSILAGVFGTALATSHTVDIAIEAGDTATDANLISSGAIIDAKHVLGDNAKKLVAIAMHSAIYGALEKDNLISTEPTNTQDIGWGTYLKLTVIVDDTLPVVAGSTSGFKYTTYLFGKGAIALGEGKAPVPTETDRDTLAGEDILINRRHFILHPRGVKFTSDTVVGSSPTNAELGNADNWSKVYTDKNIRLARLITNG